MGAIFNQGLYHSFEAGTDTKLKERYGNPPVNLVTPTRSDGVEADGFKPGTPIECRRLTNDKGEIIYPGAYFISGLSVSGEDVIVWVWGAGGWQGPYGG